MKNYFIFFLVFLLNGLNGCKSEDKFSVSELKVGEEIIVGDIQEANLFNEEEIFIYNMRLGQVVFLNILNKKKVCNNFHLPKNSWDIDLNCFAGKYIIFGILPIANPDNCAAVVVCDFLENRKLFKINLPKDHKMGYVGAPKSGQFFAWIEARWRGNPPRENCILAIRKMKGDEEPLKIPIKTQNEYQLIDRMDLTDHWIGFGSFSGKGCYGVFNIKEQKLISNTPTFHGINFIAIDPSEEKMFAASGGGEIFVVKLADGSLIKKYDFSKYGMIEKLSFHRGKPLLGVNFSQSSLVFDLKLEKIKAIFQFSENFNPYIFMWDVNDRGIWFFGAKKKYCLELIDTKKMLEDNPPKIENK